MSYSGERSGIEHSKLGGLDGDDHTQYLPIDGSRSMTGPLSSGSASFSRVTVSDHIRFGYGVSPEDGLIRLAGSDPYYNLITRFSRQWEDALLQVEPQGLVFPVSSERHLTVRGYGYAGVIFESDKDSTFSGIQEGSFFSASQSPSALSTHYYGPSALDKSALSLTFIPTRNTTVAGLGPENKNPNIRLLLGGLGCVGETSLIEGTDSNGCSVFQVDDQGRVAVGQPLRLDHAVPLEYLKPVTCTFSSPSETLPSISSGREGLCLVQGDTREVVLPDFQDLGVTWTVKDVKGKASKLEPILIQSPNKPIDGSCFYALSKPYECVRLIFVGDGWAVI